MRAWNKKEERIRGRVCPVGTKRVLFFSLAGGPAAEILQQARLPVVGHDVCSRSDWWGSLVTTSMVCAGGDGQLGSCNVSHFSLYVTNTRGARAAASCTFLSLILSGRLRRSPELPELRRLLGRARRGELWLQHGLQLL